jgi:hypothetical protein
MKCLVLSRWEVRQFGIKVLEGAFAVSAGNPSSLFDGRSALSQTAVALRDPPFGGWFPAGIVAKGAVSRFGFGLQS